MKTQKILLGIVILLCYQMGFAQQGINYKAIIKDGSGNIVANTNNIILQFKILQGTAQTIVYEEVHSANTNANGVVIVNIGEGTVLSPSLDAYSDIDWSSDTHFLNVQIDIGDGVVDIGTIQFMAVPYAIHATTAETATTAINVTGLETIDEGNGIGWRIIGRDPNNYDNIGLDALDLSFSQFNSTTKGASGQNSTTMGIGTTAFGFVSTAMGSHSTASNAFATAMGQSTTASGHASTAMGLSTTASGQASIAMGESTIASAGISTAMGYNTIASGFLSTAMGTNTNAPSFVETAIGSYNTTYLPNETGAWNSMDRLFVVGNGTSSSNTSDAFIIRKDGTTTINGTTSINGLLIVTGAVVVNGAVVHASDIRLKKDIEALPYGLKEILQLQPKAYNWKDKTQAHKSLGLIAQEVQPLIKEIVNAKDDEAKTLGISYTELIPVLINAIKEQQAQIEALKAENKSKDTVLAEVLKRLNTLENSGQSNTKKENNLVQTTINN